MKIAIVNDLLLITEALRRAVLSSPHHEVIWVARNGAEAVELCAKQRPELILMDLIMPGMNGVETTRRIMQATPCAILVVTATVEGSVGMVFDALGAGAIDAMDTPTLSGPGMAEGVKLLQLKISMIERIVGTTRESMKLPHPSASGLSGRPGQWLFAIGTSAGGPAALAELLGAFPRQTPAGFVVIQHLDRHFASGLAEWLGGQIRMPVRLALDHDVPEPGVVLLPNRDDHLVLTARGSLTYTPDPKDYVYRPSIDAFFQSVSQYWKGPAAGVLLTGMGRDGAQGLKKMRETGFTTIAQDQKTSAVYGMPKAAAQIGAAARILPLPEISTVLAQLL